MNAEILSIGDELLIGQVINSNQAFIAERLNTVGIYGDKMTTVGDQKEEILSAFGRAYESHDVVTVTGGLGPTHDDITRAVVCTFFQTDLIINDEALENVKRIFARRNTDPRKINEEQALVPRGCTVIQNRLGTAPGYFFERDRKVFIVMPGVPYEMKAMMNDFVIPYFEKRDTGLIIRHRTLKTTGIAESFLAEQIGDVRELFSPDSGMSMAYLPSSFGVRLRITAKVKSIEDAENKIRSVELKLRNKIEKYIYAADEAELEDTVGKLLTERRLTLSVAESCTGGLITDRITNVSGSSTYFERGIVTYSNNSKIEELGVSPGLISQHGAVSREVAEAMAAGIRVQSRTDIGLSTTGIAGPTGGSPEKPVGLVWIGYSDQDNTFAIQFHFGGERRIIKERAAQAALELVRRTLLKSTE
ncbi:MAG: competence/damage-inducible protein A [Ignavibacteriae bacterium]|nr:MAG: competence/damage-inducible protein A [Ignavibacteriota bacterium]